jgi:hypothetical protein
MNKDFGIITAIKTAVAEYVAVQYKRETQIFDDGKGFLFITVGAPRMTDSFKLVVWYAGKIDFHIEIADANDVGVSHNFHFPSMETAVDAYMAIFTFHVQRVLSRVGDI